MPHFDSPKTFDSTIMNPRTDFGKPFISLGSKLDVIEAERCQCEQCSKVHYCKYNEDGEPECLVGFLTYATKQKLDPSKRKFRYMSGKLIRCDNATHKHVFEANGETFATTLARLDLCLLYLKPFEQLRILILQHHAIHYTEALFDRTVRGGYGFAALKIAMDLRRGKFPNAESDWNKPVWQKKQVDAFFGSLLWTHHQLNLATHFWHVTFDLRGSNPVIIYGPEMFKTFYELARANFSTLSLRGTDESSRLMLESLMEVESVVEDYEYDDEPMGHKGFVDFKYIRDPWFNPRSSWLMHEVEPIDEYFPDDIVEVELKTTKYGIHVLTTSTTTLGYKVSATTPVKLLHEDLLEWLQRFFAVISERPLTNAIKYGVKDEAPAMRQKESKGIQWLKTSLRQSTSAYREASNLFVMTSRGLAPMTGTAPGNARTRESTPGIAAATTNLGAISLTSIKGTPFTPAFSSSNVPNRRPSQWKTIVCRAKGCQNRSIFVCGLCLESVIHGVVSAYCTRTCQESDWTKKHRRDHVRIRKVD